jgi:hypothetical protein
LNACPGALTIWIYCALYGSGECELLGLAARKAELYFLGDVVPDNVGHGAHDDVPCLWYFYILSN